MESNARVESQKPRYRPAVNLPHSLSVRVTAAERETLHAEAKEAGLSVSRFLVRMVTERRYPPTLRDREELFRTRFLLEKAGGNLNQIAHRLNAATKGAPVVPPTLSEIQQIARMVKVLATEIKRRLK